MSELYKGIKFIYCIKKHDTERNEYFIVECFEDHEEAYREKKHYEKTYIYDYTVETMPYKLKEEKEIL
jgi:hypothetical protein